MLNVNLKKNLKKKIKKLVLFVFIMDILYWLGIDGFLGFSGATTLSSFLAYTSIFILLNIIFSYGAVKIPSSISFFYKFWLILCVIGILRGLILSESYWDYKYVIISGIPLTLVSLNFFIGSKIIIFRYILKYYLEYIVLISFLFIPLTFTANQEIFSRLVIAISIFIVFIPYLKKKKVLTILLISTLSVLIVITFRTNILKFSFSILILGCYYFRKIISRRLISIVFIALFSAPLIFLAFGLNGSYNIFEKISENEEYITYTKKGELENLTTDTRTFLYQEVIFSVLKSNNLIFGEGLSTGYQSDFFTDKGGAINGKRYRCEVHFLNIFLYFGLTGVLSYTLFLFFVCYKGIYNSNNILAKMLSLLIASRFLLSFLEEFTQYDMNFFFFWLIVGLLCSSQFRSMSDKQIKLLFN